jgi:hypothetical protein
MMMMGEKENGPSAGLAALRPGEFVVSGEIKTPRTQRLFLTTVA